MISRNRGTNEIARKALFTGVVYTKGRCFVTLPMHELHSRITDPIVRVNARDTNVVPWQDRDWLALKKIGGWTKILASCVECHSLSTDSLASL